MNRKINSENMYSQDFDKLSNKLDNMEKRSQRVALQEKIINSNCSSIQPPSRQYYKIHKKGQIVEEEQFEDQEQQSKDIDIDSYFTEMKKKLSVIFKFYASFGDRINVNYLKSNKMHKMIADANLKSPSLNQKSLDIMFVKINKKSNMDFDSFLRLLVMIAETLYPNYTKDQSLILLLEKHFLPLYENIISQTDLGDEEIKFQQPIDQACISVFKFIGSTISKIYQSYFPWQYKQFKLKEVQEEVRQRSHVESALFTFLKDFDICPALITKSTAYLLYTYILQDQQLPKILPSQQQLSFSLNKFCCYLVKIAYIAYDQLNENEDDGNIKQISKFKVNPINKFCFLLDRMELSNGFINLDSKAPVSNHYTHNLLKIDPETLEQLIRDPQNISRNITQERTTLQNEDSFEEQKHIQKKINQTKYKRSSSEVIHHNQYSEQQIEMIFKQCNEQLLSIYKLYAGTHQENGQDNQLVGSKWFKFLKDANLVQQNNSKSSDNFAQNLCRIPHSEIDLIFVNACKTQAPLKQSTNNNRSSSTNQRQIKQTMSFTAFTKAIQCLSEKIYSEIDQLEGLKQILVQNILPLSNRIQDQTNDSFAMKEKLQTLMNLLKDSQVVEFLGLLHKSILVYYKFYSNSKSLITSEKFLKFYKDFEIFPDLLGKNKIIRIFSTLAKLYESNHSDGRNSQRESCIDQHMFVESLALSAMELQINQDMNHSLEKVQLINNIFQKICYLIERMNQSEGPKIVQRQLGHTKFFFCQIFYYFQRDPSGQNWDMLIQIRKKFPWLFKCETLPMEKSSLDSFLRKSHK